MAVKDIDLQTELRRRTGGCPASGSRVADGSLVCGFFGKEIIYTAESTQGHQIPGCFLYRTDTI